MPEDTTPTQSLIAPTRLSSSLSIGDTAPSFALQSHTGQNLGTQQTAGKPLVLFFYLSDQSPICAVEACAFRDLHGEFQQLGINILGVGVDPLPSQQRFANEHNLPFSLLYDTNAHLSLKYGAADAHVSGTQANVSLARTTFLIDANNRIARIYRDFDPAAHAAQVLADAKQMFFPEEPRHILQQAPVLLIPSVLSGEFCRQLIETWESEGNVDSGFMVQENGRTVGKYDYDHKIRRDHFMKEGPVLDGLKGIVGTRVIPQIRKAYNFEVSRFEDFRIACYDASRGGYFRPHRDNTTEGTAHRVWAMSLLLNDDYEGGFLRFPEFGQHRYRPGAGSAVIFSCSLLHEATDVTAGRRFVLLSFLYGERQARLREQYSQRTGGNYRAK